MSRESSTASAPRCLLVWTAASIAAGALVLALLPDLRRAVVWLADPFHATDPYSVALSRLATVLLVCCVCWWWLCTTFAVIEAATSMRVGVCPRLLRRGVLLACGISLAAGLSPAVADQASDRMPPPPSPERAALVGLRLPDRAVDEPLVDIDHQVHQHVTTTRVHPGDTLWSIAARTLPRDADNASIAQQWQQIWHVNRQVVGDDPDLIRPGATLRVPSPNHQEM